MNGVREVVQGALPTIHSPSLCFWNVLEKLGHSEIKGPETYREAALGESKCKQVSETAERISALTLNGIVLWTNEAFCGSISSSVKWERLEHYLTGGLYETVL